jgi:hypothetical protein
MKHIKEVDLDMRGNLDADDAGQRIASAIKSSKNYSNFANLIRVKMDSKMPADSLVRFLEQISDAFHHVGVDNCVIIPVTDRVGIQDITVDEVVTDLRDRVAFNDSKMHYSDEFICSHCGLITRENCRYEIDEENGDETCYEFEIKYCPRCGRKIIEE